MPDETESHGRSVTKTFDEDLTVEGWLNLMLAEYVSAFPGRALRTIEISVGASDGVPIYKRIWNQGTGLSQDVDRDELAVMLFENAWNEWGGDIVGIVRLVWTKSAAPSFDDDEPEIDAKEWELDYKVQERCAVCARGADHRCSKCKQVYYCGKECQEYDWHHDGHKEECSDQGDENIGYVMHAGQRAIVVRLNRQFDGDFLPDRAPRDRIAHASLMMTIRQLVDTLSVPYVGMSEDVNYEWKATDIFTQQEDIWSREDGYLVDPDTLFVSLFDEEERNEILNVEQQGTHYPEAIVMIIYRNPVEYRARNQEPSTSISNVPIGRKHTGGHHKSGGRRRGHKRGHKGLSRSKARKMAHEGRVHGHEITDKQRRYFYWVAGGSKEGGRRRRISADLSNSEFTVQIGPLCPPQQTQSGLIDYRQIRFGKELGRGAFGVVWSGTYMSQPVAIKTIQGQVTQEAYAEFSKEASLLANIPPNKNIVKFIGITQNPLVLVTELVTGGALDSRLKPGKPPVSWSEIVRWAQGIASGMDHLHAHGILHRDLATRNVLLDKSGRAKVTDFGLSVRICSPQDRDLNYQQREFFRGPYKWMPPESLAYQQFSVKSDVWAYGVTLWEILSRRAPFEFVDIEFVKHHVINSRLRLPLPRKWPQVFNNIMAACWRSKPQDRPSMRRVLSWLGALQLAVLSKSGSPAISDAEVRQLYQPTSPIQGEEEGFEEW